MMIASHIEQKISEPVVAALRTALGDRLVAVVLFGSRARGEASAGSDWDLLIIAEGLPEKPFERHLVLTRALPPSCEAVSLLARTPEEFEAHVSSLYLDIALDGKILYDPHGYATARLASLCRLMEQKGLYRERIEAGDVWEWSTEPLGPWALEWEK